MNPQTEAPSTAAPSPVMIDSEPVTPLTLVLGGGCFWCTEAVFLRVRGVLDVESGYANGDARRYSRPSYDQVCTGDTGYNEVVKLVYDPDRVSTGELLEVFFAIHDPTTLNRQGNDVGSQYRSGIYFTTPDQQVLAAAMVHDMNLRGEWGSPVVTEVLPLDHYCAAEAYHQNYFAQHPYQGYCAMVAAPKVAKFRDLFPELDK